MVQKGQFGFPVCKKHHSRVISIVGLLILLTTTVIPGHVTHAEGIIYVDRTATGSNNGTSWENAFTNLQAALSAAVAGEEIWVAEGVYKPGSQRTDSFALKSGVALYGGFAGGETSRAIRNGSHTVLSGDIDNDDIVDENGITARFEDIKGNNSYHVITADCIANTSILDKFTITAGQANVYGFSDGGGVHMINSSPTFRELDFSGNLASINGGAIYNQQVTPLPSERNFHGGSSQSGSASNDCNNDSAEFQSLGFFWNTATFGGAIFNDASSPTIEQGEFQANIAYSGGAIYNAAGSSPYILRSRILNNGVYNSGGGLYNLANSNPTLVNVVIFSNGADYGAGIYNLNSSPSLINTTSVANYATQNGKVLLNEGISEPVIINSIIWDNWPTVNGQAIYNMPGAHLPTISHSDIQGSFIDGVWDPLLGIDNGHNIDADPLMNESIDGDLFINAGSPAIDAGSHTALLPGVTTDLVGNLRWIGMEVDMGAYEYGTTLRLYFPLTLK